MVKYSKIESNRMGSCSNCWWRSLIKAKENADASNKSGLPKSILKKRFTKHVSFAKGKAFKIVKNFKTTSPVSKLEINTNGEGEEPNEGEKGKEEGKECILGKCGYSSENERQ